MPDRPQLLVASNNSGKVEEFRGLLEGSGWDILGPADLGLALDVEESGTTYAENAELKARSFLEASGMPALADDSGLEVDALGGEPGPLHHVNGWDGSDQEDRIAILLRALEGESPSGRSARFRAVLLLLFPDGTLIRQDGECQGCIATLAAGGGGFGYDPVFIPTGESRTLAELTLEEKNDVSHRARAARGLRAKLMDLAGSPSAASEPSRMP